MPIAQTWIDRTWLEYRAGNLTRAYRDVLTTLRTFRGAGGIAWPSHATLADRAKCSVRTVQRALHQAQLLGLVSWAERRVRAGWRWLRTSNAYRLLSPAGEVRGGMRPAFRRSATTGQNDGGGENLAKKEALRAMMNQAAGLPDLLALRRVAFQQARY